jgi:hypothetical protein
MTRGCISYADAITAAERLGATTPAAIEQITRTLGLALEQPRPALPELELTSRKPVVTPAAGMPVAQIASSLGGTAKEARLDYEDIEAVPPTWLTAAARLPVEDAGAIATAPEPLLASRHARAVFATLSRTRGRGSRVDLEALVRRAARLAPLTPLPLLPELATAPEIVLLLDVGDGMEPYADDIAFMADWLAAIGGDRVTTRSFAGTPLLGLDPDPFSHRIEPWRPPGAGGLAIAVTDLGVGAPGVSRDRGSGAEWRAFAAACRANDVQLRLLTVFSADQGPAGVDALARLIAWDTLDRFRV